MHQIEDELEQTFRFYIYRDKGKTGRFEITLYPNQTDDTDPIKGILMHSKHKYGKMLESHDYGKFIDDIKWVAGIKEE